MKKNVLAFLLGLMYGLRGVSKTVHLVYLSVILFLWTRPAHFTWHFVVVNSTQEAVIGVIIGLLCLMVGFLLGVCL